MLASPTSPGQPRPGATIGTAIELDVGSEALDKFLWIFYNPTFSIYKAPAEDWACILELANRWKFSEVKQFAIRELHKQEMSLIDRIVLYQNCRAEEEALIPLYAELCARDQPLSLAESEKLGVQTAVIVFQAREALRSQPAERGKSPLPENVEDDEVENTVREILQGVPQSNRKSISLNGWAAAYEEALASMSDAQARTRRARRIPREEPTETSIETVTERETEASTPINTEPTVVEREFGASHREEEKPSAGTQSRKKSIRKSILRSLRLTKK